MVMLIPELDFALYGYFIFFDYHVVIISLSLGPHCAYFRMQTLKPQVAKVSTVCVAKIFALVVQHSQRSHLIGW